jgi:steroid delta-isomerase-like uncharacterized protein
MTHDEIHAFVDRYIDAWRREDVPALVACYAPMAEILSPMFHQVVGESAITSSFHDVFRVFGGFEIKVDDVIIDTMGEIRVVLVLTATTTHRGDVFGHPASGRRVPNPVVFILRLENGRIVFERRFYDFTGLLMQLGILKAKSA